MKKHFISKLFCLMVVVAMALGIVGCSDKDSGNGGNGGGAPTTYTVTFDVQGHGTADAPQAQTVEEGGYATDPGTLTEAHWNFGGWYEEAACATEFVFSTKKITANTTVYAKWTNNAEINLTTNKTPTIYLAGDSTVQSYADGQYIAGWGQYLNLFLDENITVVNAARGGRSSRSFINEDRLFKDTDGTQYKFSENGGKSIEETIKEGDFLFIQFGHNDDASKGDKGYSYMPDRMVPLGEADENGVYPTTAPASKRDKTYLPDAFLNKATASERTKMQQEIAKYGPEYYAYGDGTYKWYLKQFIDLAREKGAIPVLVTPVARVSFNSDGTLKSGAGLHGENFAYVQAVRQLADEEDCLLIDNFAYTKQTLETATTAFADFLMAIVPNQINNGPWPTGYDNAYQNPSAGYDKMEGTHYNKYGAYLTAAYVAESVISSVADKETHQNLSEYFTFSEHILTTPSEYIEPSNRISISKVAELEGMFNIVEPTNPNRTYKQPSEAIAAIEALKAKGDKSTITEANYEEWKGYCEEARAVYESLNFDYRGDVTNLSDLEAYEAAVKAARPKPKSTVVLSASNFTNVSTPVTVEGHTFSFHNDLVEYAKKGAAFNYNDVNYAATTKAIRLNGNAGLTGTSPVKYIEFTVTGPCTITMVASGGGSTVDVVYRYIQLVDANKKAVCEYAIGPEQAVVSNEITEGGTYRIGSKGSNIDLYYVIIEYYA